MPATVDDNNNEPEGWMKADALGCYLEYLSLCRAEMQAGGELPAFFQPLAHNDTTP